jgi:hypothetical protein
MLKAFKVVSIWKNKTMPVSIIQVHKLIGVKLIGVRATLICLDFFGAQR